MSTGTITEAEPIPAQEPFPSLQYRSAPWQTWRRFRRNRLAVAGLIVLVIIALVALLGPAINEHVLHTTPERMDASARLVGPSSRHLLGADRFGRDVLARLLAGSRVSLAVGFLVVGVSMTVGILVGVLAGAIGGLVDNLLMRMVDTLLAVPSLYLILAIVAWTREFTLAGIVIVIGITGWMGTARLIRAEILSIKERDYVLAAWCVGVPRWQIILRHMMPNVVPTIVVAATLGAASAILVESGLSFLGLGVQPPDSSWGSMLHEYQELVWSAPSLAFYPGMMIMLTVLSFNFVGDGLREAFDPRRSLRPGRAE